MKSNLATTADIWEQLRGRIRQFLRSRVSDEQTAEDLLQETFLRIHSKMDSLKNDQRVAAWVFQIARNLVTDHYRARVNSGVPVGTEPMLLTDSVSNINAQVSGWLPELINELPETYRETVRLFELEGIPQREIAERLKISLSGVKSKVQRGRRMLKDALLDCCTLQQDRFGNVLDYEKNRCDC